MWCCSLKSFGDASSAKRPDSVAWMTGMWQSMLECGRKNGSADLHIGCNWQKTSGRRERALAASKVWHGRENEDHDLLRCMWSLHRCTYLLFVLVHMGGLTQLESDSSCYSFGLLFGWVSSNILACWSACFWTPWVPTPPDMNVFVATFNGAPRASPGSRRRKHHELSTWRSIGGGVFYPFPYLGKTKIDICLPCRQQNLHICFIHGIGFFKKHIITNCFKKWLPFLCFFRNFGGVKVGRFLKSGFTPVPWSHSQSFRWAIGYSERSSHFDNRFGAWSLDGGFIETLFKPKTAWFPLTPWSRWPCWRLSSWN